MKSWTGERWGDYERNFVTALSESTFTQVKVRLEFMPDQTVNYQGWELQDMKLYSIHDEYLDVAISTGGVSPKIPMKINGIFPNPSNGQFQLNVANYPGGRGSISVFNLLGQEILSFELKNLSQGRHYLDLNLNKLSSRPVSSGMVIVQLKTEKEQAVKKCVLLKY